MSLEIPLQSRRMSRSDELEAADSRTAIRQMAKLGQHHHTTTDTLDFGFSPTPPSSFRSPNILAQEHEHHQKLTTPSAMSLSGAGPGAENRSGHATPSSLSSSRQQFYGNTPPSNQASPFFGPASPSNKPPISSQLASRVPTTGVSVSSQNTRNTAHPYNPSVAVHTKRRFSSTAAASGAAVTVGSAPNPRSASFSAAQRPSFSSTESRSAVNSPPSGASSYSSNGPLNTNSPVALAAAAAVTPERLSRLLMAQGPLAIRHLTTHLAMTIRGFGDLSLSKQRRLIIAALDAGDQTNGITFEKVGWGRWAAHQNGETKMEAAKPGEVKPELPTARERDVIKQEIDSATAARSLLASMARRRASVSTSGAHGRPPISPTLNPTDQAATYLMGGLVGSSTAPSAWTDDVDLEDDDMMFHSSRKPIENAVFDDDDEDDDVRDYDGQTRHSETDEEDWQSMGAESLRRESMVSPPTLSLSQQTNSAQHSYAQSPTFFNLDGHMRDKKEINAAVRTKEEDAISALVQLRSL
ncbi:YALI0C09232p [Yarrowia lipolytica CLIB122]|uniref:YALI0C09232p n=1 Tax=Yarrowia lipolytica (strain CLIB 122 / E 150) TaxID=284591 RepID=Q6CCH9_YARLI|nr:YALI0C09232p [Yarrowia lipolytica CLIB122]CAG81936.2 YALI0C09232p [Yarrowia lipolytica CLIB122]|eukprot:XP_501633.2 YALI0C09232p [Yarrowia lipolytica CLIB122]